MIEEFHANYLHESKICKDIERYCTAKASQVTSILPQWLSGYLEIDAHVSPMRLDVYIAFHILSIHYQSGDIG